MSNLHKYTLAIVAPKRATLLPYLMYMILRPTSKGIPWSMTLIIMLT